MNITEKHKQAYYLANGIPIKDKDGNLIKKPDTANGLFVMNKMAKEYEEYLMFKHTINK